MKTCTKCKEVKPPQEFWDSKLTNSGLQSWCKSCSCRQSRAYQRLHRKEKREWARAWQERNRDKANAYARKYYETHREKCKAATIRWEKANPEIASGIRARADAKKRGATILDLTVKQWQEIKAHHESKCAYCRKTFDNLEREHVVPIKHGGQHTASNVVPACKSCNRKKNNLPVEEFLKKLAQ